MIDWIACLHRHGERGAAWCDLLDMRACPVAWNDGPCVLEEEDA